MRQRIIITLVTLLVLVGLPRLVWDAEIHEREALTTFIETFRDILISILQISATLLLFGLIFVFLRWMLGSRQGMLILPFDNATGDAKFDGKAISDSLRAELSHIDDRIGPVIANNKGQQKSSPKKSRALSKTKREAKARPSYKGRDNKQEPFSPNLYDINPQTKERLFEAESSHFQYTKTEVGKATSIFSDSITEMATVGAGGATLSIGRILITLKQLLSARDPQDVISGSQQKFGTMARLVARKESFNEVPTRFWEVSQVIESDNEIPNLVNELAFRIYQDTKKTPRQKPGKDSNTLPGHLIVTIIIRQQAIQKTSISLAGTVLMQ